MLSTPAPRLSFSDNTTNCNRPTSNSVPGRCCTHADPFCENSIRRLQEASRPTLNIDRDIVAYFDIHDGSTFVVHIRILLRLYLCDLIPNIKSLGGKLVCAKTSPVSSTAKYDVGVVSIRNFVPIGLHWKTWRLEHENRQMAICTPLKSDIYPRLVSHRIHHILRAGSR